VFAVRLAADGFDARCRKGEDGGGEEYGDREMEEAPAHRRSFWAALLGVSSGGPSGVAPVRGNLGLQLRSSHTL
jgi:hypothetical protein